LTDGRMKYIWFPRQDREQLFDLARDPGECRDLSQEQGAQSALKLWRERLIAELAPRNAGLTDGNRLVCQAGKPYTVSPHYRARVDSVANGA